MEIILLLILIIVWAVSNAVTALIVAKSVGCKRKISVKPQTEQTPLLTEKQRREFENFLTYNGRPQEEE